MRRKGKTNDGRDPLTKGGQGKQRGQGDTETPPPLPKGPEKTAKVLDHELVSLLSHRGASRGSLFNNRYE